MDENTNILVSIILPVFEGEKFLQCSINSILNQSHTNFELVIVDDCSKDKSWEIIKTYRKKDERIKCFLNEDNLGCAAARNIGLMKSLGEYIAFIDQDDIWYATKIEEQLKNILETKADVTCCGVEFYDSLNKFHSKTNYMENFHLLCRKDRIKSFIEKNLIDSFSSVLIKKSVISAVGQLNSNLFGSDDYEYWLRVLDKHSITFQNMTLVQKIEHGNNYSWLNTPVIIKDGINIIKKFSKLYKFKNVRKIISKRYFLSGIIEIIKKNNLSARKYFIKSIKTQFTLSSVGGLVITCLSPKLTYFILKATFLLLSNFRTFNSRWFIYLNSHKN